MSSFLFKTEPTEYSFGDLQRDKRAVWDGISNALALIHLRSVKKGDLVVIYHSGTEETSVLWSDVILILTARLIETRLEIKERMTRKKENEIVDTNEFFRDEVVIDFYTAEDWFTWRVSASGFDFSCLGSEKALVANENIGRLQRLIIAKALNARVDDSYPRLRNLLELVWSTQSETESSGWRRERPGKLSVGVATTKSNETQFTRYSRLRRHFLVNPENPVIL